jgi:hypothetical protein
MKRNYLLMLSFCIVFQVTIARGQFLGPLPHGLGPANFDKARANSVKVKDMLERYLRAVEETAELKKELDTLNIGCKADTLVSRIQLAADSIGITLHATSIADTVNLDFADAHLDFIRSEIDSINGPFNHQIEKVVNSATKAKTVVDATAPSIASRARAAKEDLEAEADAIGENGDGAKAVKSRNEAQDAVEDAITLSEEGLEQLEDGLKQLKRVPELIAQAKKLIQVARDSLIINGRGDSVDILLRDELDSAYFAIKETQKEIGILQSSIKSAESILQNAAGESKEIIHDGNKGKVYFEAIEELIRFAPNSLSRNQVDSLLAYVEEGQSLFPDQQPKEDEKLDSPLVSDTYFIEEVTNSLNNNIDRLWLLTPSLKHKRREIRKLYKEYGEKDLLSNFTSGAIGTTDDRAYIAAELLSGPGGVFKISLNTALVVSQSSKSSAKIDILGTTLEKNKVSSDSLQNKNDELLKQLFDSINDTIDSEVIISIRGNQTLIDTLEGRIITDQDQIDEESAKRDTLNDLNASITRLLMNGGSMSLKLLYPILSGAGGSWAQAASVHGHFGIGDRISDIDEDKPVIAYGIAGEYLGSLGVFEETSQSFNFDLVMAIRTGYTRLTNEFPGLDQRDFFFAQGGIGLRQNESMTFSILYTLVNGDAQKYTSKWSLNVQFRR